ncbi:MAG: ABC transporter substrate-binding protein [Candidatus Tectomicrobia bacterium]|nr:ABC transporter substrate-binding protein [Candidatus Tectomicrobia bacterium]
MSKIAFKFSVSLLLTGFLPIGLLFFSFSAHAAEKVTFQLGWVPIGRDVAFFTAKEKGFYRQKGLDVTIVRGYGGADAVKKVATKAVQFSFGDVPQSIIVRSKGEANVKQLFMYHAKSAYAIHTLKGYGVRTPKDLEGKKLGGPSGSGTFALLPVFAAANGFDLKKVEIVHMSPEATVPSLLAGRVQGIDMYTISRPVLEEKAVKQGKEVDALAFAKWGVDIYNNGILARDDTIAEQPGLVRGFVEATSRGSKWAIENPEQATGHFLKAVPEASREVHLKMWKLTIELMLTPEAMESGLGYMSEKKWRYTRELIVKAFQLEKAPPLSDLYTNQFIPKTIPAIRKAK